MRRSVFSVLLTLLAACALAAVPAGAATPKTCGDVTVSNAGGSFVYMGVKATDVACATAKRLLRTTARSNHAPSGWTFGNTYARFDQSSQTSTCGYYIKHGKKRITWHTTGGDGCT